MNIIDLDDLPSDMRDQFRALIAENEALKRRVQKLATDAAHDELTGLANRRGFLKLLDKALAFSKRYRIPACLVFIDLNDFKQINDTHGHNAGDLVLTTIAKRIARQVRSSDIVARLGGDEFVVLFWQVSEEVARSRSGLLMHAICRDEIVVADDLSLIVRASAGVAVMHPGDSADTLLERADRAMYEKKSEIKKAG